MRLLPRSLVITFLAVIGACTYQGSDIADPVIRKFHWFSFVEGEDIRSGCQPGSPDRFRLVYNGIYEQQLRIYEFGPGERVGERRLDVKVRDQANLTGVTLEDPLAPWRGVEARRPLDGSAYDGLVGALERDGAFGPPAVGLSLPSHSYYWTAASCRQGSYAFTGWAYPSAGFERLEFPARLLALDDTGVAMRPAGPIPVDLERDNKVRFGKALDFTLKIGRNGLN